MTREDMIMTLVVNHMENRESLENMTEEQLIRMMDYYHEEYEDNQNPSPDLIM